MTSADWNDYLNWLYEISSRDCTDSIWGDIDGYAMVNLRDLAWIQRYLWHGGEPLNCDSAQPPLSPQPSADFFLVHNTIFPAGDTVAYLTIEFINQRPALALSAAFRIKVDGMDSPFSTTTGFVTPSVFTGWWLESYPYIELPDTWSGPGLIGGSCGLPSLPPGRRPVTDALPVFAPSTPFDREIAVELIDMNAYRPEAGVDRNSYVVDSLLNMYTLTVGPSTCPIDLTGDLDLSGTLTSSDIIVMVNYVFKSGPDPLPCVSAGDVNCSGAVSSADIIFMVNHVFMGQSGPCDVCLDWTAPWGCL